MVEFNHDKIPLYKLIVHIAQIVLSVTVWILEIIVFKGGDINGQNGWTFGVVRGRSPPPGQQTQHTINQPSVAQVLHRSVFADVASLSHSALFQPQHGYIS